jgi:hypothetical protein
VRALYELTEEERLLREELPMPSGTYPLRLYRVPTHRNWRRQAYRLIERVSNYSSNDFARAVRRQGEAMFDAALPRFGFMPKARDVREWQGRRWESCSLSTLRSASSKTSTLGLCRSSKTLGSRHHPLASSREIYLRRKGDHPALRFVHKRPLDTATSAASIRIGSEDLRRFRADDQPIKSDQRRKLHRRELQGELAR